jgi:hypothetical protein
MTEYTHALTPGQVRGSSHTRSVGAGNNDYDGWGVGLFKVQMGINADKQRAISNCIIDRDGYKYRDTKQMMGR